MPLLGPHSFVNIIFTSYSFDSRGFQIFWFRSEFFILSSKKCAKFSYAWKTRKLSFRVVALTVFFFKFPKNWPISCESFFDFCIFENFKNLFDSNFPISDFLDLRFSTIDWKCSGDMFNTKNRGFGAFLQVLDAPRLKWIPKFFDSKKKFDSKVGSKMFFFAIFFQIFFS